MRARALIVLLVSAAIIGGLALVLDAAEKPSANVSATKPAAKAAGCVASKKEAETPVVVPRTDQRTRIQIDVFQLTCSTQELAGLDIYQLGADKASVEQILQRLGKLGKAELLARADSQADLHKEFKLTSGERVPVVSRVKTSSTGVVTPSFTYEDIGVIAELQGEWLDRPQKDLACIRFEMEVANIVTTELEIGKDTKGPAHIQSSFEQQITLDSGVPVLMMSSSLPMAGYEKPTTTVIISRLTATRLGDSGKTACSVTHDKSSQTMLHMVLIELRGNKETLVNLDLKGIDPDASDEILRALRQSVKAEVVSSPVILVDWPGSANVTIGERVPVVSDVGIAADGKQKQTIKYEDIGSTIQLEGRWLDEGDPKQAEVALTFEHNMIQDSDVEASGQKRPVFTEKTMEQRLVGPAGKAVWFLDNEPFLMGEKDGVATRYIIRMKATPVGA